MDALLRNEWTVYKRPDGRVIVTLAVEGKRSIWDLADDEAQAFFAAGYAATRIHVGRRSLAQRLLDRHRRRKHVTAGTR